MRIDCPSCGVLYQVSDVLLWQGRRMQCHACAAEWAWEPPHTMVEPETAPDDIAPPVTPTAIATTAPARRKPGALLAAAWAASILLLLAASGIAVRQRAPLMQAWPPSTRLFAALGLADLPPPATAHSPDITAHPPSPAEPL